MTTTRSTLTPAIVPDDISDVLVETVVAESLAAQVATQFRTDRKSMTFPVLSGDLTAYAVDEGEEITLSDIVTTDVKVTPRKYVAANKVTREALDDSTPQAENILGRSIGRAIASRVDSDVFGALAVLPGATAVGETDLTDLDGFHASLAALREEGAVPSAILVSPATALRLSTMKESGAEGTRKNLLEGSPQDPATLAVAGVPFVVSRAVPDTIAITVDGSRLALVVRQDAEVERDDSVYRLTGHALIQGTARIGFGSLHAAAVAHLTITPDAA